MLPTSTASSPGNYLFATVQQLNTLSNSLSTVNVSTSTGAGISVTEPTANNFVFTTALSNAGGITLTPVSGSSTLGIGNAGVLSVTAGSNVVITGTASAPVINAAAGGTKSQVNLQPQNLGLPNVSVQGPGAAASVTIPLYDGISIPVVAGGLYAINGGMVLQTGSDAYDVELLINSSGNEVPLCLYDSSFFNVVDGPIKDLALPFSGFVIPSGAAITLVLRNSGSAGALDTSSANFTPLTLTRIS